MLGKISADNILKYFFLCFPLAFYANCLLRLRRQFAWTVNAYFLGKYHAEFAQKVKLTHVRLTKLLQTNSPSRGSLLLLSFFYKSRKTVMVLEIQTCNYNVCISHITGNGQIQQTTNWWYISYFSQKTGSDILCKQSQFVWNFEAYFWGKKREKKIKMLSAEFFTQHAKR